MPSGLPGLDQSGDGLDQLGGIHRLGEVQVEPGRARPRRILWLLGVPTSIILILFLLGVGH